MGKRRIFKYPLFRLRATPHASWDVTTGKQVGPYDMYTVHTFTYVYKDGWYIPIRSETVAHIDEPTWEYPTRDPVTSDILALHLEKFRRQCEITLENFNMTEKNFEEFAMTNRPRYVEDESDLYNITEYI